MCALGTMVVTQIRNDDKPFELLPVPGAEQSRMFAEYREFVICALYDLFSGRVTRTKTGPLTPTLGGGQLLGEVVAP